VARIRRATAADFPALVALGHDLARESPKYQTKGYSPEKTAALGERLLAMPEHAQILVAESGGEAVGMMVIAIAERFFSDECYVTDFTLYVKPEHRGGLAFARLVQAAEAWARERGIRDACFGVSTEIDAERTVCAYQRMGYRLTGYTLTKTLAHGD
jgi:GNAT superfamily N-acetyltransferase